MQSAANTYLLTCTPPDDPPGTIPYFVLTQPFGIFATLIKAQIHVS